MIHNPSMKQLMRHFENVANLPLDTCKRIFGFLESPCIENINVNGVSERHMVKAWRYITQDCESSGGYSEHPVWEHSGREWCDTPDMCADFDGDHWKLYRLAKEVQTIGSGGTLV